MVEVSHALLISAPWIQGNGTVTILNTKNTNNTTFFKFCKSDSVIHRAVVGRSRGDDNRFKDSSIFQELADAREAERLRLLEEFRRSHMAADDTDELLIDDPPDLSHLLPETITVRLGAVGSEPIDIKVMCEPRHKPLWLEASSAVFLFLHERVCIGNGNIDNGDQASEPAAKRGKHSIKQWFDAGRHCWRVRYAVEGAVKTKDFRVTDDSPKEKAEADAAAFCASLQ
jgi:hypothetical protein